MPDFFPTLKNYCETLAGEFDQIDAERQAKLSKIGAYIARKRQVGEVVNINVICTHNSRRSQVGQLWLEAAAAWYGVDDIHGFSGGTEATAFNPRAVAAMWRAGFNIEKADEATNPVYEVRMGENFEAKELFSKRFDHEANPQQGFAAVMVCDEADEACPFVPGAEQRFSLPFDDPKAFDDSELEAEKYDERCRQIAREFFYLMEYAKKRMIIEEEKQAKK